jgi:hypothetical protein
LGIAGKDVVCRHTSPTYLAVSQKQRSTSDWRRHLKGGEVALCSRGGRQHMLVALDVS